MGIDKVILPKPRVMYQPTYTPGLGKMGANFINTLTTLNQDERANKRLAITEQNAKLQQQATARAMAVNQMKADYAAMPALIKDWSSPQFKPEEAPGYIKMYAQVTGRPDTWAAEQMAQFVNPDGTVDPAKFAIYRQKTLAAAQQKYPMLKSMFEDMTPKTKAELDLTREKVLSERDKRLHPEKYRQPVKVSLAERWLSANPGKTVEDWLDLNERIKDKYNNKKKTSGELTQKDKINLKKDLYKTGSADLALSGNELKQWVDDAYKEIVGTVGESKAPAKSEVTVERAVEFAKAKGLSGKTLDNYAILLKSKYGFSDKQIKAVMQAVGGGDAEAENQLNDIVARNARRRNAPDIEAVNTLKRYEDVTRGLPQYSGSVPFGTIPKNFNIKKKKKVKKNYPINVLGITQAPKGR